MAADPKASTSDPKVQHSLDGDSKILCSTVGSRASLRSALIAFQKHVHRFEGSSVQIVADIKIRIAGGEDAREHTYNVTITSDDFVTGSYARLLRKSPARPQQSTPGATASSPPTSTPANGVPVAQMTSTPQFESRREVDDDELMKVRPFKRSKPNSVDSAPAKILDLSQSPPKEPNDHAAVIDFLECWKAEWVEQGGWLFDNITRLGGATREGRLSTEQRLASVQDVLGQSINSAQASSMKELANISQLIPWVENCRKVSADKSQAREEKWRISSASFHDGSRRDREAAERRIEKKMEDQNHLLMKLAKINGLDSDDADGESGRASRETSLGAQLTAELNQEASSARPISRYDTKTGTITVDD